MLMPIDIQLRTLTAVDIVKPEEEWTARAYKYVKEVIQKKIEETGIQFLYFNAMEAVELDAVEKARQTQLLELHD